MKITVKNIIICSTLVISMTLGIHCIKTTKTLDIKSTINNNPSFVWILEKSLKGNQEEFSRNGVVVVKNGKLVNKDAAINFAMDDDVYSLSYDEAVAAINALEAQYGSTSSATNTTTAPAKEEPTETSSTTSTESATASQSTSSESVAQQETKTKETKETKTEAETSTSKKEKEETTPSYTEEELEAAWEETRRVEPTCTEPGVIEYTNSLTGVIKTEELETVDHNFVETSRIDPTCTEAGEVTYTCDMCGKTKTENLNPAGHQPEEVSSKANLFTSSTKVTKCSVCGEVISEDKVPATIPLPITIIIVLVIGGVIAGVIIKRRRL